MVQGITAKHVSANIENGCGSDLLVASVCDGKKLYLSASFRKYG